MNDKLTLSFSVATFIAAIGLLFFLSDVRNRVAHLEREHPAPATPADTPAPKPAPGPAGGADAPIDPLATQDPVKKLDWIIGKLEEIDTRVYEGVVDLESELYQQKREVDKIKVLARRLLDGLRQSGDYPGLQSSLPEPRKPLTIEQRKEYKAEAERWGIQVEDGQVVARALLNGAQDKAYPVEYFMTRFPEAGHETLVHLMGKATLEDFAEPPYPNLQGLSTALYKALLAAGFEQGEGSHPEGEPKAPGEPVPWVMASGDTVYMVARWTDDEGQVQRARATDWVLDPETKSTLPEDCFKFTGSARVEHRETGDEMLLAEARGFIVSVYPDRAAMIEVALESAARNNYAYNWSRLPSHDGSKPFYIDLIFSKTPLTK